ncbi:hypothetical protein JCM9152_1846 [Halalkalibacter hemicellulosilyticusJCM 9152]|uniref:Uncharacterized protein n=1 Tax=Halalkalibacter hemicellulosilyticusJCM 9152 TaxID=1236971 RepID=W4QFN1_9BACI|nr:hypothetical protein JCM9152_1846 [Halalkalibacter hemicellulosilyticusJCM 9152]
MGKTAACFAKIDTSAAIATQMKGTEQVDLSFFSGLLYYFFSLAMLSSSSTIV